MNGLLLKGEKIQKNWWRKR